MQLLGSKDILFLVLAFCILWVTVFLCWMLYYVMRILRNTSQIIEEFRVRLQTLLEAVNYVRDKVEYISGLMGSASEGITGVMKKVVTKKASDWMKGNSKEFDTTAKEAVGKAVLATEGVLRKVTRKIKSAE